MAETRRRIKINAGGKIFETFDSTLLSKPNTLLADVISGSLSNSPIAALLPSTSSSTNSLPNTATPNFHDELIEDGNSELFVDVNPTVFESILDYYRTDTLILPKNVPRELFRQECAKFGILNCALVDPSPDVQVTATLAQGYTTNYTHNEAALALRMVPLLTRAQNSGIAEIILSTTTNFVLQETSTIPLYLSKFIRSSHLDLEFFHDVCSVIGRGVFIGLDLEVVKRFELLVGKSWALIGDMKGHRVLKINVAKNVENGALTGWKIIFLLKKE
ncbi:hypothetical protein HK098_001087 [Nowakowskiella sp. JEL0407]|nr:hypothetical protein HK098_001087 [Nowakowskiella sp. JEL0407]